DGPYTGRVERQLEYVLRTVEERGVRFVRLWFTDVLGFLKSVEITPAELEVALEEGMTFDGSTIQGYSRIQESDMLAKPDPNTFELLPNTEDDTPVARMFCDIQTFAGEPFDGDPRWVLKRNLDRARERGFTFFVGPEMEFFYFKAGDRVEPMDHAGYFDLTAHDLGSELRKQTVLRLEAMGIPVEYSFHENGPSQHEIDLRYTDALTMADNIMTFRLVAKEVAHDHGVYATFMPKPMSGAFGSGMHSHLSLFEGDVNAFHDPGDEHGLSKVAKHFIAGLLRHAPEITAITNQWVNSYKRLIPGYEAPAYICWARNNRSALVRVPLPKRAKIDSTRIEFRSPDPACNPYLAYSVILAAGMKGIEEGYDLPPEATNNIYEMTPEERLAEGLQSLPTSLHEAIEAMEGSELVAEALGEHVYEYFILNKRQEWADYKAYVTPFEIERYLGTL
ncbi:MAG: glutamine synthetase, partial [Actinomycetia bacterium]|nr:glutamine synthetase [Actinomycetes bacterium]